MRIRFWHLLGNPPKNTTKGRDLIFNEGIRLLNMADTSLDRFTWYEMIQISSTGFNFWSHPKVIFNLKGHICDCSIHIKSCLKSSLGQVGVGSNIASLIYPLGSHTCSLFAPFHMDSWPKVKFGSHYLPLLGFIYSYFAPDIPFWSRFCLVYLYFPIFSFIYPHLSLICPYLVIFTLNCPNLTIYAIFTLHIYSSSKTAPLCKILKQSEN